MKHHIAKPFFTAVVLLTLAAGLVFADDSSAQRSLPPTLDSQGRFWVYRNGPAHPKMPFLPYGWMSDMTNLTQIIETDIECRDHPNTVTKPATAEREYCVRVKFKWGEAAWAGIAFISGPDKPAWWGDTAGGKYYNFSTLPKKKLVFYARGEKGGEVIKAQVGVLGDKPFGDSLAKPIASEDIKLTTDWTRHEIELSATPASDLANICSGFDVMAERSSQTGSPSETQFYIDDVYFE